MTALQTPAPDAPAEEWGRLAVSLPGWRWTPGMQIAHNLDRYTGGGMYPKHYAVPDPDDPATEGCLLRLLGPGWCWRNDCGDDEWYLEGGTNASIWQETLGRACIAAAAALGRWPGGEG